MYPRTIYTIISCLIVHSTIRPAVDMKAIVAHLAKRLSDLKQNGTQEKTPFSDTVFHDLSHGVLDSFSPQELFMHVPLKFWATCSGIKDAPEDRFTGSVCKKMVCSFLLREC